MPTLKLPRVRKCNHAGCTNPGICLDGKCGSHTETRNSSEYTLRDVTGINNPFGMELECVGPQTVRKITKSVSGDGSVYDRRGRGHEGHEIKILDDASRIGRTGAITAVKARLAGASVNRTCGFHVHTSLPKQANDYDSRQALNWKQVQKAGLAIQDEAFRLFPSRDGNYSARLYMDDWDSSLESLECHCSWISRSNNHPTIEVRIHPGTLSPSKIFAWGKVCVGLQKLFHDCLLSRDTETVKRAMSGKFIELFRKGSIARNYLETRRDQGGRNVRFNLTR